MDRACLFSSRRLLEGSSGEKIMTCGQRAGLDFIVAVLAGVDGGALTTFLFALLLWTGMKLSSDVSSSDMEYSSVSSVSLEEPTRFLVADGHDDFWPDGPPACSSSMAAGQEAEAPRKSEGFAKIFRAQRDKRSRKKTLKSQNASLCQEHNA